jgi:endonuclease/exonuclease/phosphatase family metal-dependent hydrolase
VPGREQQSITFEVIIMKRILFAICGTAMALGCLSAYADNDKADIKVMTQNQYLGADLSPVIAATPANYPFAIVDAVQAIATNNIPERAIALAESIADRQPHLVALQEVYAFDCISLVPGYDACTAFPGAFNDHLVLTEAKLADMGSDYRVVAVLQNLTIPALPVFLPGIDGPAMIVSVIDRDVILARGDIEATPAAIPCTSVVPGVDPKPGPGGIGCHYTAVATVETPLGNITVERGFIAANATIKGEDYLFVNSHLEVRQLGDSAASTALQPAQAMELNIALAGYAPSHNRRVILAGDFNSSPADVHPYGYPTPYQQLSVPFTDTWMLRPGKSGGFTCCEAADLLNDPSSHDRRIDIVFANPAPVEVKANVMDAKLDDKTASGLWPSDHGSVIAELSFD